MIRHERLEEDYKVALSQVISFELKDPDINGLISVTSVKITPDQKYAKAYVSIYNTKYVNKTLAALNKSAGFIKGEIAKKVKMRNVPSLTLELDKSMEYGEHMDRIINDLNKN